MIHVYTIQNSILNSCTYILYNNSKDAYLIDCGDVEPIHNFIQAKGKIIKGIFLTHCHYDHIYGINDIIYSFPNVVIYGSKDTIKGLKDSKINLSKYNGTPMVLDEKIMCCQISKDTIINLLNEEFKVLETPGHDAGCLSYLIRNMLFTGDSYIPDCHVYTKWKNSNRILAIQSEEFLKEQAKEYIYIVYPGHIL